MINKKISHFKGDILKFRKKIRLDKESKPYFYNMTVELSK